MLALTSTILSAICLALTVIIDRTMVADCYRGNTNHAWFVSSIAGSVFGLLLTFGIWMILDVSGVVTFATLVRTAYELLVPFGILMLIAGALSVQLLLHYFRCFGEDAHPAALAAWIAATPIVVYIAMAILSHLPLPFPFISGEEGSDLFFAAGVVLATIGLVGFEAATNTNGDKESLKKYKRELLCLLACNTLGTILVFQVLVHTETTVGNEYVGLLALLPFYWIGFGAGIRVMFKRGEWRRFISNWKRMKYFLWPILVVEVIGMLVFYFEYIGLGALHPAYVAVIVGGHVLIVYILNWLLGLLRWRMKHREERRIYFLGLRLLRRKLPEFVGSGQQLIKELLPMTVAVVGIVICSVYASSY